MKFTELILAQSGSMFEASRFVAPCEVSRTTNSNYLSVFKKFGIDVFFLCIFFRS